jgi:hypothetical protein
LGQLIFGSSGVFVPAAGFALLVLFEDVVDRLIKEEDVETLMEEDVVDTDIAVALAEKLLLVLVEVALITLAVVRTILTDEELLDIVVDEVAFVPLATATARVDVIPGFVAASGATVLTVVGTTAVDAEPACNCWYTLRDLTDQYASSNASG